MQRLAAYLLERYDIETASARQAEGYRVQTIIEGWMARKRARFSGNSGTYAALDGSDATFRIYSAVDSERSWRMYELSEINQAGRKYVTSISITISETRLVVFITMDVGSVETLVTRIDVDARCPWVVQELVREQPEWSHGASKLQMLSGRNGFEAGETLGNEILNPDRTIPFVVLSCVDGDPALPALDERLASDLAGVANVYRVDEDASWGLTDTLGKSLSTYAGAVRIYWPRLVPDEDRFRHQLWTAAKLTGTMPSPRDAVERIRRQLRSIIMSASAASVIRPAEIDDIREASAHAERSALEAKARELEEHRAKASSSDDYQKIAELYSSSNEKLIKELTHKEDELSSAQREIESLRHANAALQFNLNNSKKYQDEIEPDQPESEEKDKPPLPGEIHYYKKKFSAPGYDVLTRIEDCGHNTWQPANKADKAEKGLKRIYEHSSWKRLSHCGACTGGGVWRVQW